MSDRDGPRRDRADGEDSGMRIKDPEKFHKTRRLKQIHNARETFTEVYRKAEADRKWRNGPEAVAAVALDYVRQLEPLVEKSDSDLLDKTVKVGGHTVSVRTLLDRGGTVTTSERVQKGQRSIQMTTEKTTHRMNKSTSLEVVRMCDHWLDEYVDFDIEDADADTWQV